MITLVYIRVHILSEPCERNYFHMVDPTDRFSKVLGMVSNGLLSVDTMVGVVTDGEMDDRNGKLHTKQINQDLWFECEKGKRCFKWFILGSMGYP